MVNISIIRWVLAVVGGLVALAAAPAIASGREVAVAVRAYTAPTLIPHSVSALRLVVRVPPGAQVKRGGVGSGVPVLAAVRGRCRIRVALFAEASDTVGRLPAGRAAPGVAVRAADGVVGRVPSRLIGPQTSEGVRFAIRVFRLPDGVLPHFSSRMVFVGAMQGSSVRHCPKGALDRVLLAAVARPRLAVVGDYPPDAPPAVVDVASLPRWTIGGYREDGQFGSPMVSVGDTNGDGRPELAIYDIRGDTMYLVDADTRDGAVSIADPHTASLRLLHVGSMKPVVPAGDIDGDGRQDIVVLDAPPGLRQPGARVVLGRASGGVVDVTRPGAAYLTILGPRGCRGVQSIRTVDAAGDMDGDGVGDLVVASTCRDATALWVVPGGGGPGTITLGVGDGRAFSLAHSSREVSVAALGDVNGDGLGDVAVGAHVNHRARVTVIFGAATHTPVGLVRPGARGFVIAAGSCRDLYLAGLTGDVNGDGRGDVLITTGDECPEAAAFVVFGTPATGRVTLATLVRDGGGISLDAPASALGGDATGDSLADLLVNGQDNVIYLVAGRREPGAVQMRRLGAGGRGYRVPTGAPGSFVGDVVGVPDIDGDGRLELAFATPYLTSGGLASAGAVQILGSRSG